MEPDDRDIAGMYDQIAGLLKENRQNLRQITGLLLQERLGRSKEDRTAALQRPTAAAENTLYCSFCGKSQHEVEKLIAGPAVFICDECTILCMAIIEDKASPTGPVAGEEGDDNP